VTEEPRESGWSRDPGWREAIRGAWLFIIPFGLTLRLKRMDRDGADGLVALRSIFLAFCSAIVLFALVLTFLNPPAPDLGPSVWVTLGLVGYGLVGIFIVTPRIERPLACDSDVVLAGTYRTRFFIRIAIAESVSLFGFVAVFLVGPAWVYYGAGAVTLMGFARYAPSAGNLIRDQAELLSRGCERPLIGALRHPRASPDPG
jgi:F0F1-type ATP synthase membrane subunit c/vacuolar-type H+-ATPase subunit K